MSLCLGMFWSLHALTALWDVRISRSCFNAQPHGGGSLTWTAATPPSLSQPSLTCPSPPPLLLHILPECLEQWRKPVWLQSKVSPGSSNPFRVIWHDFMEVSLGENSNVKHNLILETWKKKPSDFFSSTFPHTTLSGFPRSLSGVITPQWGPEVKQQ